MKALVEATPISGPARIGRARSLSRAIVEVSTLTTETMRPPWRADVAEGGEGVGGLARLADEDAEGAGPERRLAVAELGGDLDLDRQAGDALEPVLRHVAGVVGGAAGDEDDAVDAGEVDALGQRDGVRPGAR